MTKEIITLDRALADEEYRVTEIGTDATMRARLCELGLVNGTVIIPVLIRKEISSYLVRGAQIALRRETSRLISVREIGGC